MPRTERGGKDWLARTVFTGGAGLACRTFVVAFVGSLMLLVQIESAGGYVVEALATARLIEAHRIWRRG